MIEIERPDIGSIFSVSVFPRFNNNGEFVGTVLIMRDITECKRAELVLRTRALQQSVVVDQGQKAVAVEDLTVLLSDVTKSIAETLDTEYCKVLELLPGGKTLLLRSGVGWKEGIAGEAIMPTGLDSQAGYTLWSNKPVIVEDLQAETRFSGPQLLHDHNVVSGVSLIIHGENGPWGVLGVHSTRHRIFSSDDINFLKSMANLLASSIARMQLINALKESKEKYDKLIDNAQDAIVSIDDKGIVNVWNNLAEKTFGYSKSEIIGKPVTTIIPERFKKQHNEGLKRFLRTRKRNIIGKTIVVSGRTKEGVEVPMEMSLSFQKDGKDRYTFTAIIRDITERKKMENMLRNSNEKLKLLLSSIPSILIELAEDYRVRRFNSSAEKRFGLNESDVTGKPFRECEIEWNWEEIINVISVSKETNNSTWIDNFKYKQIDGSTGFLGITVNPLINELHEQVGFILLMKDITERKNMEQQLVQAQKLESIGQLAAGIAHEINTPTQYVTDNTSFLKDAFKDINKLMEKYSHLLEMSKSGSVTPELTAEIDVAAEEVDIDYLMEEIPTAIEQSLEGLDRVKNIVYAMKNFSHPDNENKKPIEINEAIKNTITVARNEWKYVAEVKTDFDSSLTSVPCFPGDFNQTILNLIVNAAHAIGAVSENGSERKGIITISTRCDGEWAEIRVSDNGTGIPEDIRNRIFDPFFTTKEVGKGTGQGLSLVHSTVVGRHNGTIALDTEIGKGTTFIIRLPLE